VRRGAFNEAQHLAPRGVAGDELTNRRHRQFRDSLLVALLKVEEGRHGDGQAAHLVAMVYSVAAIGGHLVSFGSE
jgi:hypothetical protein